MLCAIVVDLCDTILKNLGHDPGKDDIPDLLLDAESQLRIRSIIDRNRRELRVGMTEGDAPPLPTHMEMQHEGNVWNRWHAMRLSNGKLNDCRLQGRRLVGVLGDEISDGHVKQIIERLIPRLIEVAQRSGQS